MPTRTDAITLSPMKRSSSNGSEDAEKRERNKMLDDVFQNGRLRGIGIWMFIMQCGSVLGGRKIGECGLVES